MSIGLVEQLNFEKQMPIDGNCMQMMSVTVPATGSGDYKSGSYFLINVPRSGSNYVFDPANSFLRFQVTNNSDKNLTFDHSADSFFEKIEVLHAGSVLEQISSYGTLSAFLLDCQVDKDTRSNSLNITKGCKSDGSAPGATIATTKSMYFSITFISGIVGSLCRNYIPVNDLDGSLQIRCTFAPAARVGKWSDLPNNTDTSLTFNNIEFHANMIRLSDSVLSMVKADNYTIYTESFSNFRQTVANNATSVEQLIPTRYSSLKSTYVVQRNAATSLNATYKLNPNTRDTLGIADYCFRLGSEMIPPSRIKGTAYGYVEPFEALKLSFHSGGNTIQSLGILNFSNYSASGTTDLSGLFVIGQDFESYSGRSGALLSGINTLGSDLYFSANYTAGCVVGDAMIDYFLHYDMKLIIQDGIMTVNV